MPQHQSIKPLFDGSKATSSHQQPTQNPQQQRHSSRSISPIETSFVASLSAANVDKSESGSSSSDVSPIEDPHRHSPNRSQVHGNVSFNTTALDNAETSHPSAASLTQASGRHAYFPHNGLPTTTSKVQDHITRKDTPSKVENFSSRIDDASDTKSLPRLMREPVRPVAFFADHPEDEWDDPDNILTDGRNENKPTFDVYRSQGVPPLNSVDKRTIQVGSDRQTTSTASSEGSIESTVKADQTQNRFTPSLDTINSGDAIESPKSNIAVIARSPRLGIWPRKGIYQPRRSSDKESKNSSSPLRHAVKTDTKESGKSPIDPARDGLSHARWNRSRFSDEPPSRFSDTSCSTATYDSPPSTPGKNFEYRIATPALAIVNRKRPIQITNMQSPNITRRKPTPSEAQRTSSLSSENQGNHKPLPKSPPEAQAVTRAASLEAKRDALRQRRVNLQTVVDELTNVTQRNPIAYDMATRQKMKQTIDELGKEISSIGKEEHDTGLQLHRAWKREEETSTYESSPLWVKRLAS